jgi:hypothetical protein
MNRWITVTQVILQTYSFTLELIGLQLSLNLGDCGFWFQKIAVKVQILPESKVIIG